MLSVAQQFLQEGSEASNERFIFITKVNYRPGVWVKAKRQTCLHQKTSQQLCCCISGDLEKQLERNNTGSPLLPASSL